MTSPPSLAPLVRVLLVVVLGIGASGFGAWPAYADSVRDAQWYLDFLGVPEAHKVSQGEGVTVAVVDTGVAASHQDLRGNVIKGADGFDRNGKGWSDPHDHGTRMASLVAGHGHGAGRRDGILGIAPKAKIMPITVVAPGERGAGRTAVGQGIRYATDHGADIVLVALAGAPGEGEAEAVAYAKSYDVLVVASAGNKSRYGGGAMVGYPAGHEGVLAVSAVDRDGRFAKFSASGHKVGLAAPGVDIRSASADGGYVTGDGTSQAAAIVAGLAALVESKYPDENEVDLAVRLGGTAIDKGPSGRDDKYGLGVPDVNRALSVAQPPYASKPPSASPSPSRSSPLRLHAAEGTDTGPIIVLLIVGLVILAGLGGLGYLVWRRFSYPAAGPSPGGPVSVPGLLPPGPGPPLTSQAPPAQSPASGPPPPGPSLAPSWPPSQAPASEPPPSAWARPDPPPSAPPSPERPSPELAAPSPDQPLPGRPPPDQPPPGPPADPDSPHAGSGREPEADDPPAAPERPNPG